MAEKLQCSDYNTPMINGNPVVDCYWCPDCGQAIGPTEGVTQAMLDGQKPEPQEEGR